MGITFENGIEEQPLSVLTIGDLCKLIEYAIERAAHTRLPATYALQRIAGALEASTVKRTRRRSKPRKAA
jgi:hypothetical protein